MNTIASLALEEFDLVFEGLLDNIRPLTVGVFMVAQVTLILKLINFIFRALYTESYVSSGWKRIETLADKSEVVNINSCVVNSTEDSENAFEEDAVEVEDSDYFDNLPKIVYTVTCPNCGAPVGRGVSKCVYCDSELYFCNHG